jgi:hypothetical protein
MPSFPQPDISRFSPIHPEIIVQYYIFCSKRALSLSAVQTYLRAFLSAAATDKAVSAMIARGEVVIEQKNLILTPEGKASASKNLGRDANEKWDAIKTKRLPWIALGLTPDDSDVRKKFVRSDAVKAAAIAVSFALPPEIMASLKGVQSEIVWRVVRAGLSELVGKGPFPAIEKPGPVERTLLAGLAGVQAKSITDAINSIAARAVGLEKANIAALRDRLIVIGIERSGFGGQVVEPIKTETPKEPANGESDFADRINQVALKLSTPPFQGYVAISQVYDAYGEVYSDAGSLSFFKERLVNAARLKKIQLSRLNIPEHMNKDLRDRSETPWDSDRVHFVITDWK